MLLPPCLLLLTYFPQEYMHRAFTGYMARAKERLAQRRQLWNPCWVEVGFRPARLTQALRVWRSSHQSLPSLDLRRATALLSVEWLLMARQHVLRL